MQLVTLALIANAVLALPIADNSSGEDNDKAIQDRIDSIFPPPAEDYKPTPTATTPPKSNQPVAENRNNNDKDNNGTVQDRYKNQNDNSGVPCDSYRKAELKDVPEECIKPVYCAYSIANKFGCDVEFMDTWTKKELLGMDLPPSCIDLAVCREEDYYKPDNF